MSDLDGNQEDLKIGVVLNWGKYIVIRNEPAVCGEQSRYTANVYKGLQGD